MEPSDKILVIGDLHIRPKYINQYQEYKNFLFEKIKDCEFDMIVLLGDILDTHDVAKSSAFIEASNLFKELSEKAPTFVIVGNHDISNPGCAPSDKHFFGPFKMMKNLYIVDYILEYKKYLFVPYLIPGTFFDSIKKYNLSNKKIIFAHQDFSTEILPKKRPLVITGHIHNPFYNKTRKILYAGSPMQIAINESIKKYTWIVECGKIINIKKIRSDIEMRLLKKIFSFDSLKKFYETVYLKAKKCKFQLVLYFDSEDKKKLYASPLYNILKKVCVVVSKDTIVEKPKNNITFMDFLKKILEKEEADFLTSLDIGF